MSTWRTRWLSGADVLAVYGRALEDARTVRTVSIDEMTGIQALERLSPGLPMRPGKVERHEFEYRSHGTRTLIAAFDVAAGTVPGTVGDSLAEDDFASFLSRADLKASIENFIAYFNETMAKPFRWTMTGKPLTA